MIQNGLSDLEIELYKNVEEFVVYWRKNIHRFCVEYLGINLHLFQKILIYLMDFTDSKTLGTFFFYASRGLGKTWLTAVYCCAKCILFPNIKIKVASANTKQAKELVKKIKEMCDNNPMLKNEILFIRIPKDGGEVKFNGGATIEVVVSGTGSKGNRCQILILDEARLMDREDIKVNLEPFLTGRRETPWSGNSKYVEYMNSEPNTEIYLTSIGYSDEWSYLLFNDCAGFISKGRNDYVCISLPYEFGIESNIIGDDFIAKQLREGISDPKFFMMEMEAIPYGKSEHSLFRYNELKESRKLYIPLIPITDDEFIEFGGDITKSKFYQKKIDGEIRILSYDIAVAAGRTNDNSVFNVYRLNENGDHYDKELSYIETMNGVGLDDQIIRLKQIFYDLECDYIVIDAMGALGLTAVRLCGQITHDNFRGIKYPGWRTISGVEKFDSMVVDENAQAVMYCIQIAGGNASAIQYQMLVRAQLEFKNKRLLLLVDEDSVFEILNKKYNYFVLKTSNNLHDRDLANIISLPFINTDRLIDEAVHTQVVKTATGRFMFDEGKGRKDRVMALLYAIEFISLLEDELTNRKRSVDISKYSTASDYKAFTPLVPFSNNLKKLGGFGRR